MAQNFMSLEEAAKALGLSTDEVTRLIDKRELFGVKDGAEWKFKPDEIERYKQSTDSGVGFDLPVSTDEGDSDESDAVLLSEEELGASSGRTGSTVIGDAASKSDIQTSGEDDDSDLKLASDSGVSLIPDTGASADSDVKLVASDSDAAKGKPEPGSDLELVDLDAGSSSVPFDSDVGSASGSTASGGMAPPGSDLTLDSGINLTSDVQLEGGSSPSPGSSTVNLGDDEFDDDDIVLGGSSGLGSGIGDSGINLEAANDSGLSLEEAPLELGGDDGLSGGDSAEVEDLSSDDDFLLTPMLELDDQESDSSGSQVIALDTDESFDDQAATLLGEDVPAMQLLEEEPQMPGAAQPVGAPAMSMAPAVPEAQYSIWNVLFLILVFIVLAVTGMMMFEMVRSIWSWDEPNTVSASISEGLADLFGLLK